MTLSSLSVGPCHTAAILFQVLSPFAEKSRELPPGVHSFLNVRTGSRVLKMPADQIPFLLRSGTPALQLANI